MNLNLKKNKKTFKISLDETHSKGTDKKKMKSTCTHIAASEKCHLTTTLAVSTTGDVSALAYHIK